jgi:dTDP-4-amino-4,6-dideoxygalactose transaminase
MDIPLVNLKLSIESTRPLWEANIARLMDRAQFVLGEEVRKFEEEFASALGARYSIGAGSGSAAIELCLRDARITSRTQQVLTSALTAPFTGIAILAAGATPVFADVDPETLQMDPDDAGNRAGRQVTAFLPVHLYGQPCRIDTFARLAKSFRKILVQDACQAHGAEFQGRAFTSFSPYVAYSFYPTKNLGCLGDGGAVVTDNPRIARRIKMLRDGGRETGQVSRVAGINSRLDEMQACYLQAFLGRLREWNSQRAHIASLYDSALADNPAVRAVKRSLCTVNHLYVIRSRRRNALREWLAVRGIGTAVHYPVPLHLQPAFAGVAKRGDLPNAEKACREIMSLPLWPGMTEDHVLRVADAIKSFDSRT